MKVLGEYVLVQQTDTKKKSGIIIPGKANQKEGYITTFEVKELGTLVPADYGLKVGDKPIFSNGVSFNGMNITSPANEKEVMTAQTFIHYLDIIGAE